MHAGRMVPQKFYDVKSKKAYTSTSYVVKTRGSRQFLVAKAPSGIESWRIKPKEAKK